MRIPRRRWLIGSLCAVLALLVASQVEAQFGRRGFSNVRIARADDFDGRFHFCRVAFADDFRGDGGGWSVDFPRADINLSIRLSELTKTTVAKDAVDEPLPLLVRFTDPELFGCPFVMMTEVGSASISKPEAEKLREYLLKGGFIWADDFWGEYAWQWWEAQLRQAMPASEFPIVDLEPGHPLYKAQFNIEQTPQIASINFWASNGGYTSERGRESETVHTRAILDANGRIMILMTHNTDIGDSFEREGDDPRYFATMSVPGYQFGVNTLLYAMTH